MLFRERLSLQAGQDLSVLCVILTSPDGKLLRLRPGSVQYAQQVPQLHPSAQSSSAQDILGTH